MCAKLASSTVSHCPPVARTIGTVPLRRPISRVSRQGSNKLGEAEENVVRGVRLAPVAVGTAFKRVARTRQLLKHASGALDLARARHKAGSSSVVELSDAQVNQTNAALALANAEYDARIQMAVLDFQAGSLR